MSDEKKFLRGWRENLTDFEMRMFVPSFRGRIENIISILDRMKLICKEEKRIQILPHLLTAIHKNMGVPILNAQGMAKEHIAKFEEVIDVDFLQDAKKILAQFYEPMTLVNFIRILEEIKNYCDGVIAVKNKTFIYIMGFGGVILDQNGGYVKTIEPAEATFMWHPFNACYSELCAISKSTLESIQNWESEQIKLKSSYLNFKSHNYQIRIYILSIVFTVFCSIGANWLFFTSGDYLKMKKMEQEIDSNNLTIESQKKELKNSMQLLNACKVSQVIDPANEKK